MRMAESTTSFGDGEDDDGEDGDAGDDIVRGAVAPVIGVRGERCCNERKHDTKPLNSLTASEGASGWREGERAHPHPSIRADA